MQVKRMMTFTWATQQKPATTWLDPPWHTDCEPDPERISWFGSSRQTADTHHGLLVLIGFDAANEERLTDAQSSHQQLQRSLKLAAQSRRALPGLCPLKTPHTHTHTHTHEHVHTHAHTHTHKRRVTCAQSEAAKKESGPETMKSSSFFLSLCP